MNKLHYAILGALFLMLTSCAPLTRGVDDNNFISSAHPAFSATSPNLKLITYGRITPQVTTGNSLNGIAVNTTLAIYAEQSANAPMAIIAHSEAPVGWFFDSDLSALFSIHKGFAQMGQFEMQTCTYIVQGKNDAFITLMPNVDPDNSVLIARRFATLIEFKDYKVTFEYRELMPNGLTNFGNLTFADEDAIKAFEKRAEAAFVVNTLASDHKYLPIVYPQGLRTRYINNNFLGTLSPYDHVGKD